MYNESLKCILIQLYIYDYLFPDVHAMNMATPTDPVVVLSVSLSIILIFLFGIGLTALLVILILK